MRREIDLHKRLKGEYESSLAEAERENARLRALMPTNAATSTTTLSLAAGGAVYGLHPSSTSLVMPPLENLSLTLGAPKSSLMTVKLPSRLVASLPPSPNQTLRQPIQKASSPSTPSLPTASYSLENLV